MFNFDEVTSQKELQDVVEKIAECEGVNLNDSLSWGEDAENIKETNEYFAEFLVEAERKWFEFE